MNAAQVVEQLKQRFPNEPEYIQAVSQVLPTIEEEYNKHPEFEKSNLIERLCIPDRVLEFPLHPRSRIGVPRYMGRRQG